MPAQSGVGALGHSTLRFLQESRIVLVPDPGWVAFHHHFRHRVHSKDVCPYIHLYDYPLISINIHQYPSVSIYPSYINEISINIHLYPFISIITHMTYYYIHHHRLAPDELPIGEPCRYPAGSARRLGATEQREGLGGAWYVLPKYGLEKRTTWNYQMNFDVFLKMHWYLISEIIWNRQSLGTCIVHQCLSCLFLSAPFAQNLWV